MAIEEDIIVGPDQDGPSEYMADIGKGVLLANAKLKLLEEFVGSTSSDLCSSIHHEFSVVLDALQELSRNQHSNTKDVLERLATSLNAVESRLLASIDTSCKESSDGIAGLNGALAVAQRSLGQAIADAEKQTRNQASDHQLKLVGAIQEVRDLLRKIGQEHQAATIKHLDGLETRIKNVLLSLEQLITQKCALLSTGQEIMRKWLLWLTIAIVLLSGTSVALLVAILMRK